MTVEIGEHQLVQMRAKDLGSGDGMWYAYQNAALDSSRLGEVKFLKAGPGCTFHHPPARFPDRIGERSEVNWAYVFVGVVDLDKGEVNEIPYSEVAPDEIHGDESEDGSDSSSHSGGELDKS